MRRRGEKLKTGEVRKEARTDPYIRALLDETIVSARAALSLDELVDDLKGVLSKAWKDKSQDAITATLRILAGEDVLSMDEMNLVMRSLEQDLGTGLAEAVRQPVFEIQEAAYLSGGMEVAKPMGVDFALRIPDKKSLAVLNQNTLFWVGDYFGDHLQGEIRGSLKGLFEGGRARADVMWDLKLALEDLLPRSDSYWDLLADHTATKVREVGRVAGYEQAGIRAIRVRAHLDSRTTEICRRLHGHIIATEDLRKQVSRYLGACETKDKEKIKASWPWWNDKRARDSLTSVSDINRFVSEGEIGLPPYHARCRTITVAEMILEPGSHDVPEKERELFGFGEGSLPIEPEVKAVPRRKKWEMIPNSQLGSNPGGKVLAPDGAVHYAKFYDNAEQARSELLANDLHAKLGLGAPKASLQTLEWNGEKRLAIATEWMDDMVPVSRLRGKKWTANDKDQIAKHYLGAALNGNWDVVGMEFDNLAKKGRKWYCLDQGGSFAFRARGGPKPYGAQVMELDSLLSPGRKAAEIFNRVLTGTIQADPAKYRKWLGKLTDRKIRNALAVSGMDSSLADTIIARRKAIEARLLKVEHEMAVLQTSEAVGGVKFRNQAHQRLFEDLVPKYEGKDAAAIRDLFRIECPSCVGVLNDWRGSTQGLYPSAFKMKAELLEERNLHAYSKKRLSRERIRKAPTYKAADEAIPDEEYIRIRAMTQAYYRGQGTQTIKLYRGTDGRAGVGHAERIKETRRSNQQWKDEVYQIEQNAVTGWSSDKRVADNFGKNRGGITEIADIRVDDVILPHEIWPKNSYMDEKEFLVIGDRVKTVPLGNIEIGG